MTGEEVKSETVHGNIVHVFGKGMKGERIVIYLCVTILAAIYMLVGY